MEERRKKKEFKIIREKKCPNCESLGVGQFGKSFSRNAQKKLILIECYKCGTKFWMSESDYKP